MFKDFFYFTKGQRIGIIVLIILILLVMLANYLLPMLIPEDDLSDKPFIEEVNRFKKSLVSRDSLRSAEWERRSMERQLAYEEKYKSFQYSSHSVTATKYSLFSFDPNKADSIELCRLGIKPFVASNILKYRKKGGLFRSKAEFSKVYGILPEKFKELEPYISIQLTTKLDTIKSTVKSVKQSIVVDLNSADTTLLMQVKGIGRGYAKGIIRFRHETGGFVTVDQLRELYGMTDQNLERIRPFCTVNVELVQKIKVNTATVDKLNAHPYISFYQAKAIYELRRKKIKLKSSSDLKELTELKPDDLIKIQPYLSFE